MQENPGDRRKIHLLWKEAASSKTFRIKTLIGIVCLVATLCTLPVFFTMVEAREGIFLRDRLLQLIPATDVSAVTFIIIWSMTLLWLTRCALDPRLFLLVLYAFLLLTLSRMLTIAVIPLNAPAGLIPLKDPLTNVFYGGQNKFITKDLFYSGHTSSVFLVFLTLTKKWDRIIALVSTWAVAVLVLVQHVHYTIDVLAAFVFTYVIYRLAKLIARY